MGGALAPAMAPLSEELYLEKAVEDSMADLQEEPALMAAEAEGESERSTADEAASSETGEAFAGDTEEPEGEPDEVMVEEAAAPAAEVEEGFSEDAPAPEIELAEGMAEEESAPALEAEAQASDEDAAPAETELGESKSTGRDTSDEEIAAEDSDDGDQLNLATPTGTAPPSPYPTEPTIYYEEPAAWEAPRTQISPVRVLEIIFALGVLGFGITAWALRRRDKR